MNMSSSLLPMDKIMWLKSLILVVAFGLLPGIAAAAQVSIFASFKPDPSQPMRNVFKNETPPGDSYCGWAPQYCHSDRYSIGAPITHGSGNRSSSAASAASTASSMCAATVSVT